VVVLGSGGLWEATKGEFCPLGFSILINCAAEIFLTPLITQ
jgi:hypothetical protein